MIRCSFLLAAAALCLGGLAPAFGAREFTIYRTEFDSPPFIPAGTQWAGVDGWITEDPSSQSDGVVDAGGAVLLGGLPPLSDFTWVSRYFGYDWRVDNLPILVIETRVGIVDSTSPRYDYFGLHLSNKAGQLLFGLGFDNYSARFVLDNGNTATVLPNSFRNDVWIPLVITLDFSTARATVATTDAQGGTILLVDHLPVNVAGRTPDLGALNFSWLLRDPANPGDNFLVVDYLRIRARSAPEMRILGGRRARTAARTFTVVGRQAASDHARIVWRKAGEKRWRPARSRGDTWQARIDGLRPGRNAVDFRLLNAAEAQIDRERVVITRR